jgi:hypothetical protein
LVIQCLQKILYYQKNIVTVNKVWELPCSATGMSILLAAYITIQVYHIHLPGEFELQETHKWPYYYNKWFAAVTAAAEYADYFYSGE